MRVLSDWLKARFAYVTNTGSGSISGYRIGFDGEIELLDPDGRTGVTGGGPIDLALTDNGRFLYSLNTGTNTIGAFRVRPDGSLIELPFASGLPAGANGARGPLIAPSWSRTAGTVPQASSTRGMSQPSGHPYSRLLSVRRRIRSVARGGRGDGAAGRPGTRRGNTISRSRSATAAPSGTAASQETGRTSRTRRHEPPQAAAACGPIPPR
jgi:hypothetical protein